MKKFRLLILIPLSLCIFCIGSYFAIHKLKIGSHPVDRIQNLLLTSADFPPGWEVDYVRPLSGNENWGEENIDIGFKLETGQGYAHQHVYRFTGVLDAMYAHYFLVRELLVVKENLINFVDFKSRIANDWYIGCMSTPSNGVACDVLGRYEDYIIYFSISAPRDQLTADQLKMLINSIDSRMDKLLLK